MTDNDTDIAIENEQKNRAARRTRALHALQRLSEAHLSVVPQSPSQYMCAVGAQVGGVDLFTARRIYRAMVAAAYERPTIN
jgi:hypothetical protein